jgi:hypothetical protein
MKHYSAAQARVHLAQVLDLAEQGRDVVIERRGIRFTVRPLPLNERPPSKKTTPRIVVLDPAVEAGQWTWRWSEEGIEFVDRRKARRRKRA